MTGRLSSLAMEFKPSSSTNQLCSMLLKNPLSSNANQLSSTWPDIGGTGGGGGLRAANVDPLPKVASSADSYCFRSAVPSTSSLLSSTPFNDVILSNPFRFNSSSLFPANFEMARLNSRQANSISFSSLDLTREMIPTPMTQPDFDASFLDSFNPLSLDLNKEAIWNEAQMADTFGRFSALSFNSDGNSNSNSSLNSEAQARKGRPIIGRGAGYYARYGINCISIPKDVPINYPPSRKIEPMSTIKSAIGGGQQGLARSNLSRKKPLKNTRMECAFCKNIPDGNPESYKTHWLKDSRNVITCPVLRAYICPICDNKGGDKAHTMRYCPLKRLMHAVEFQNAKQRELTA